jgi:2-methylisocitrate lyase-like PEP mutase family enzyme
VDVFLADGGGGNQSDLLEEAVARARSYQAVGVDCVFPILLHDEVTIATFVDAVDAPVNILALPQAPTIDRLAELGVARVSHGSLLHRRAMQDLSSFLADLAR